MLYKKYTVLYLKMFKKCTDLPNRMYTLPTFYTNHFHLRIPHPQ